MPVQLPPLPTTRSKPPHLDIGEEGGRVASGRGEVSGGGEAGGSDEAETTTGPSWLLKVTSPGLETSSPDTPWTPTPEPGATDDGRLPAVVFKEDVTPGPIPTFDLDSLAVPLDGDSSGKPPVHVIIVNVHSKNQSGE